ncbi:PAO3 [Symbiodinium sp. CCMP2592]|nr:PAO3 [Symbiodinium sp. CCMP2592]
MCRGQLQTGEDGLLTMPTPWCRTPAQAVGHVPIFNPEREQLEAMAYTLLSTNAWLLQHAQQLQCKLYHANQQLEDCNMQCYQMQHWLMQMGQHHRQDVCQETELWCHAARQHGDDPAALQRLVTTRSSSSSPELDKDFCDQLDVADGSEENRRSIFDVDPVDLMSPAHRRHERRQPTFDARCCKAEPPPGGLSDIEEPAATEGAPPTAAGPPQQPLCKDSACDPDRDPHRISTGSNDSTRVPSDNDDLSEDSGDDEQQRGDDRPVGGSSQEASATRPSHRPTAIQGIQVGIGECSPQDLHVPNLLPYLSVQELLSWRLVSRRTRSPEALIEHLKEMGSMDRPASAVAFSDMATAIARSPETSFAAACGGDVKQQKFHECQRWCMALASKNRTHFAEIQVRRLVDQNLQSLLRHCRSADESVATAAMMVISNYASDALPFVQRFIAKAMLALLEDLVESDDIPFNLRRLAHCMQPLACVLRSMRKRQRQKWVSLLVKVLMNRHVLKDPLIERLKMLWLVDDNPQQTYAEAIQQLRSHMKSTSGDLQRRLRLLVHHSCF